jgi:hypothetical protein
MLALLLIVAASAEVVLRTTRACGVRVTLRDGEVDLPRDLRWSVALRNADGSDASSDTSNENWVTALPGIYTLLVEDVEGCEPIAPRRVVVESAKWTDVTIPVQPSRR